VGDGLLDFVPFICARRNRDLNVLMAVYHADQFRSADARCFSTGALSLVIRMGLSVPTPRNDFRHVRKSFVKGAIVLSSVMALALTVVSCPATEETGVSHCYLTWQGDTSTTMTVNFHSEFTTDSVFVYYDTLPQHGDVDNYRFEANASSHTIPGLRLYANADRQVHISELTGLQPDTAYYFIAGNDEIGFTDEMSFRTVPDSGPIRFAVGGDMGTDPVVRDLLRVAASEDPAAVVIGGDIAYADGHLKNWKDWDTWLTNWEETMINPDGHMIPMILAIGNHEVDGGLFQFTRPLDAAPFYFGYFAQAGSGFADSRRSYFSRSLGPHTRIVVLDTDHVTSMTGAQRQWLESEFATTDPDTNIFAVYHVPMYPSHRPFGLISIGDGFDIEVSSSPFVRHAWLELFDDYGLTAAFEHHDHMHKRTKRLRGNRPDSSGTLYLGDGAFGRSPREGAQALALEDTAELERLGLSENYLAAWSSTQHFWLVDVSASGAEVDFQAIDINGLAFDRYSLNRNDNEPRRLVTSPN
jgi:hypothetical protein